MQVTNLTKNAKKEIVLSMIYKSISRELFCDSFKIGTLSYEDEISILDIIEEEQKKILKRIKTDVYNIQNVNDMIDFFNKNKSIKQELKL